MVCKTYSGLELGKPINLQLFFNSVQNIPSHESDEAIASIWDQAQAHRHSLGVRGRPLIQEPW